MIKKWLLNRSKTFWKRRILGDLQLEYGLYCGNERSGHSLLRDIRLDKHQNAMTVKPHGPFKRKRLKMQQLSRQKPEQVSEVG